MTGLDWTRIDQPLFDRIVDTILGRIHGGRGHAPEGRGGDEGIDYTVDDSKIIYQYKFFPDGGNTASRRRQIKRSFISAMKHDPREWVVVIPAKLLQGMRDCIHGLGDDREVKITIHDRVWLDNRLIDYPDLGEFFQYRSDIDYLHARSEALKVNPLFRSPNEVIDKIATLQRAIDASDPDWTFDISSINGEIVQRLRAKDDHAPTRSPIGISYTAVFGEDSPERQKLELSWNYGVVEPVQLSGAMVRDFKITGPELVAYEGPVAGLELLPDPDSASPWADTDMTVTDLDGTALGTLLARSRLLARGGTGMTIEVQVGSLLRLLFRAPDDVDASGRVDFTTEDFRGHATDEVLSVSNFLTELRNGRGVDFHVDGSRLMRIVLNGIVNAEWPDFFHEIRAVAEDLSVIERESKARFRYPATLTGADRVTIRNVRLMLEGHVVAHHMYNQMNAKIDGTFDPSMEVLLTDNHGWLIWRASPAQLSVLDKLIDVPEVAMGGPAQLSDDNIAAVREAISSGSTDGTPLSFRLEPDDRVRMWLPDRFKGEVLAITPWDIPGIEQPAGTLPALVSAPGLDAPRPPE